MGCVKLKMVTFQGKERGHALMACIKGSIVYKLSILYIYEGVYVAQAVNYI